jgi:serine/threonine protein kinase
MSYIHSRRIIHRDLKTLNVLLDRRNQPRVCDFGISVSGSGQPGREKPFGTASSMAPEEHRNEAFDNSVDVYSFGILLWEMLTREVPFAGREPLQIMYAVAMTGERPAIPESAPEPLERLITMCWAQDPKDRRTFSAIVWEFLYDRVEFPGTVRTAFLNFVASYGGRSFYRRDSQPSGIITQQARPFLEIAVNRMKAKEIVEILIRHDDGAAIGRALTVIQQHWPIQSQIGEQLWTLLFGLLKNSRRPSYYEQLLSVMQVLTQNHHALNLLERVPNLHSYVQPDTLDIFLYIVSFCPSVIDPKVVTALGSLFSTSEEGIIEKAVKLLCKIVSTSANRTLIDFIMKFFKKHVGGCASHAYGSLMLQCVVAADQNRAVIPVALSYLRSPHPCNVSVAYQVIIGLANDQPLVDLELLLSHIQIADSGLQDLGLEYFRRQFLGRMDTGLAQRLVRILLKIYQQTRNERAALLLFHLASLPQCAVVFQSQAIQGEYLTVSDDSAPDLLQLLILLMRIDPKLLLHPLIPVYLSSVLKYGNNQAFIIVCLFVDRDEATADLLIALEQQGVLGMICERISECEAPQVLKFAARAVIRFIQIRYFRAFQNVVVPFADEIRRVGVDATPCLMALSLLCRYEEILPQIAATRVSGALGPFAGIPQMGQYVQYLQNRVTSADRGRV